MKTLGNPLAVHWIAAKAPNSPWLPRISEVANSTSISGRSFTSRVHSPLAAGTGSPKSRSRGRKGMTASGTSSSAAVIQGTSRMPARSINIPPATLARMCASEPHTACARNPAPSPAPPPLHRSVRTGIGSQTIDSTTKKIAMGTKPCARLSEPTSTAISSRQTNNTSRMRRK